MSHLSDIRPGQVIGRYEFLAPIAQGGMAAVWAARQRGSRGFSKVVAIKTMLPAISDDPRFEKMFLDEAKIASRIRHDNVVEILDLGEENDILYLVMEWVDGESLSALRRRAAERGGIPLKLAVRIVADVCAGLHAAHELVDDDGHPFGLVHRDVSPQNILVGYDGNVKVLDFGVAKVAGRSTDTTNIGQARGKPPYMAPEQALGKEIDRRADIFSLGIILYQLLVGRHPFRGENDIATLHNIISDQAVVRPRELDERISSEINAIALRALERDPALRFQSAREFELALENVLHSELGRVRVEELGSLMTEVFGPSREDNRATIREAIRRADAAALRVREPESVQTLVGDPVGEAWQEDGRTGAASSTSNQTTSNPRGMAHVDVQTRRDVDIRPAEVEPDKPRWGRAISQVVLAMALGAALAWSWIAKAPPQARGTQVGFAGAPTVQSNPQAEMSSSSIGADVLDSVRTDGNPSTSAAGAPPNSVDQRGATRSPRRNTEPVTRRAATSGSVRLEGGLPPVPSPGF
jgi:serine/threonine-protein kinase